MCQEPNTFASILTRRYVYVSNSAATKSACRLPAAQGPVNSQSPLNVAWRVDSAASPASTPSTPPGDIAMSPDMAVRVGKLGGNGAGLWLRLQVRYDECEAHRRLAKELKSIRRWDADLVFVLPCKMAAERLRLERAQWEG
jgi:hypothetical protein